MCDLRLCGSRALSILLQARLFCDVSSGFDGVLERIRFCGILLGFHEKPPFVAGFRQKAEDRAELYVPVPRDSERAVSHGVQKAHMIFADLLYYRQTHIFKMNMPDAVCIFFKHEERIFSCKGSLISCPQSAPTGST